MITAPDRLARKFVHQSLLLEELQANGCQVIFVERPMSNDPHDQLLLQIRGAVAEYERSLIADLMNPVYTGKVYAGRVKHHAPRGRRSPLLPINPNVTSSSLTESNE